MAQIGVKWRNISFPTRSNFEFKTRSNTTKNQAFRVRISLSPPFFCPAGKKHEAARLHFSRESRTSLKSHRLSFTSSLSRQALLACHAIAPEARRRMKALRFAELVPRGISRTALRSPSVACEEVRFAAREVFSLCEFGFV